LVVFDKAHPGAPARSREPKEDRGGPEDERIALRCARQELQLLDSFVVSGEFRSRSELMREALRAFLRARALPAVTPLSPGTAGDLVEVPVRLRTAEAETYRAYGALVANGRELPDVLAELVRRGDLELKVTELVERTRRTLREERTAQERLDALAGSGEELERRGVVGR
jgi:Arc/MetJ-type ribon-helix-helix transcriptional regulator